MTALTARYAPTHWPEPVAPGEMPERQRAEWYVRHKYLWDRWLGLDITGSERGSSYPRSIWTSEGEKAA